MTLPLSRRDILKTVAAASAVAVLPSGEAVAGPVADRLAPPAPGWVAGTLSGAEALVETLLAEGATCVFGIPGAQENELWDAMKSKHLDYLLVTHEFSAAAMADGHARSTGRPGVLCVVPGPGLTNSLTGIGEALLDSVPMVVVVGDVARGDKYRPFQVHELPNATLLRPVTKAVFEVRCAAEIPEAVRQAFHAARSGEPGPAAVVVPWNLLIESHKYASGPHAGPALPFDEAAFLCALRLLSQRKLKVGIYAGLGCMDHSASLVRLAEVLQAPVATSIAGKGAMPECHPLSVGWGFGPQGTALAEQAFRGVDVVVAVGVRFSEVSTGFYSIPQPKQLIHADINPNNLGRVLKADVCVHADAGLFLDGLLGHATALQRPCDPKYQAGLARLRAEERSANAGRYSGSNCGVDPMALLLALRRGACEDALCFVDVTASQYWATEVFTANRPRTFFNPTNNQSMGWSVPAALGAQQAHPGRQVLTVTGDGCFLMSAMELSTAARERLPVKCFVLDDQAYHYMQLLQKPAYLRTTATILARLDYASLAQGLGVAYQEVRPGCDLDASVRDALAYPGPLLVRVVADYGKRPIRWIAATKDRFTQELSAEQKARFLARIGARSLHLRKDND